MLLYRLQYCYILYKIRIILKKYVIMFTRHETNINVAARKLTKRNTRRSYDCKQKECFEFCHHIFGHEENCETINENTVFGFMVYQFFRQKKGKGNKWSNGSRFRITDYDEIMNRVTKDSDEVVTKFA